MQAGARHPVPLWRHLSKLFVVPLSLAAVWLAVPSAAAASVPIPDAAADVVEAVEPVVVSAAPPARAVAEEVGDVVRPAAGAPSGHSGGSHPVHDAIAPIAGTAAGTVPGTAVELPNPPQRGLDERARHRVSHISASASGEHVSSGRAAHGHGTRAVPPATPSPERSAPAHGAPQPSPVMATGERGSAGASAGPDAPPASAAPGGSASGAASSLFGGGLALLVASLMFAGPGLRRRVSLLPAVCRPAAFLLVLERPG